MTHTLGIALFGFYAVFNVVMGVGGPLFLHSSSPRRFDSLWFHKDLEQRLYGVATKALIEREPILERVRTQMTNVLCAYALGMGICQLVLLWLDARARSPWAIVAVAASDLAIPAIYFSFVYVSVRPTINAHDFFQLHPLAWFPLFMVPVATALCVIGR